MKLVAQFYFVKVVRTLQTARTRLNIKQLSGLENIKIQKETSAHRVCSRIQNLCGYIDELEKRKQFFFKFHISFGTNCHLKEIFLSPVNILMCKWF